MPAMKASNCCNAPVTIGGEGMTHWHICSACHLATDIVDLLSYDDSTANGAAQKEDSVSPSG